MTLAVAYPMGAIYLSAPPFSLLQGISFLVTGFALFRAGSFVHEIAHMRGGQMLSFRIVWNLLCGIPFIMPSHFYENHVDHHNSHHYGTSRDGEYLPLGAGPVRDIFWFFIQAPFFPLYIALRLLLSPITFVDPRLRTWVLEHMSSYVINFRHRLTIPKTAPRRAWAALEIACSIRLAIMLGVVAIGIYPWSRLVQIYCLAVFTLLLNHIRNLVAHRYRNTGEPMSHADQLADSVTITGRRFSTELFFPLGLRYHALHHLFPGDPVPQPGPGPSPLDGTIAGRFAVSPNGRSQLLDGGSRACGRAPAHRRVSGRRRHRRVRTPPLPWARAELRAIADKDLPCSPSGELTRCSPLTLSGAVVSTTSGASASDDRSRPACRRAGACADRA